MKEVRLREVRVRELLVRRLCMSKLCVSCAEMVEDRSCERGTYERVVCERAGGVSCV